MKFKKRKIIRFMDDIATLIEIRIKKLDRLLRQAQYKALIEARG